MTVDNLLLQCVKLIEFVYTSRLQVVWFKHNIYFKYTLVSVITDVISPQSELLHIILHDDSFAVRYIIISPQMQYHLVVVVVSIKFGNAPQINQSINPSQTTIHPPYF